MESIIVVLISLWSWLTDYTSSLFEFEHLVVCCLFFLAYLLFGIMQQLERLNQNTHATSMALDRLIEMKEDEKFEREHGYEFD